MVEKKANVGLIIGAEKL